MEIGFKSLGKQPPIFGS